MKARIQRNRPERLPLMADIGLDFWLTQWDWEPSILIGTVVIVGLYLYALGPLRKKYHLAERVNKWQAFSFLLGMSMMFLALVSPLDELVDRAAAAQVNCISYSPDTDISGSGVFYVQFRFLAVARAAAV